MKFTNYLFIGLMSTAIIVSSCEKKEEQTPDQNENEQENQENIEEGCENDSIEIFTVVEEMPEFPGGSDAMIEYFSDNLQYPESAIESQIQGRVFVTFVVLEDGSLCGVKVLRGIGGGCDEEAVRLVEEMPDWIPGKQNGEIVRVQYNIPVHFTLPE